MLRDTMQKVNQLLMVEPGFYLMEFLFLPLYQAALLKHSNMWIAEWRIFSFLNGVFFFKVFLVWIEWSFQNLTL